MSQGDKKKRKKLSNKFKQAKFKSKYPNYIAPSKFIEKEPDVTEVNNNSDVSNDQNQMHDLESKKRYLKILQSNIGSSANERERLAEIDRVRSEIKEISKNLGLEPEKEEFALPTEEEIQKERENRLQIQKEKLRDFEKKLAIHLKTPNTGDETTRLRYQHEKDYLEKEINNLKLFVPEKDRLPIDDDDQDLDDELALNENEQEKQEIHDFIKEEAPLENINVNGEEKQDAVIDENKKSETFNIPNLNEQLNKQLDQKAVTEQVMSELKTIVKSAGVDDEQTALDVAELAYVRVTEGLKTAYTVDDISTDAMGVAAEDYFNNARQALRDANGLTLNPKDRLIAAQKIANVMLNNYSPIKFADHKLDKYADDYVVSDDELLKKQLLNEQIPEDQFETMMLDIKMGMLGDFESKLSQPEVQPETQVHPEPVKTNTNLFNPLEEDEFFNAAQLETMIEQETKNSGKPKEAKPVDSRIRVAVYEEKLKAYNNMYKLDIDSNKFVSSVTDAWNLITDDNKEQKANGQKIINDLFKDTLKKAFDVEKGVAYDEHRLPEYAEIIKSTNELMRSAMYGFTDMYHNGKRAELFEPTAFGGLDAKAMADLTVGDSLWSMDQKSDEAWDIQSKQAKNIAEKWLEGDKPYEKMISEMKALVKENEEGIVSRKDMLDKLTAAEWLLANNEKMMVEDPEDPLNPIPNWGNRYWKALTEAREALGIDKHTSMRDMIQSDFAASAKAVNTPKYNEMQINNYVLDNDVRELADSRDVQMEQFAIQGAAVNLTKPPEKSDSKADEMTEDRVRHPVDELDQRTIMKTEPKNNSWILVQDSHKELTITSQANVT